MSENNNKAYVPITPNVKYNSFNQLKYLIKQEIMAINTLKVCQVVKVNNDNTLNIKPMVCRLDTNLEPIEPVVIKDVPILRVQGGTGGFQIVYKVGDIVLVGFCDRDTNAVKRSKKQSAPSTLTPFPLSSGVVLGAVFFANQSVYVKVDDKIYCVGNMVLTGDISVSGKAEISGNTEIGGNATITGNTTITGVCEATAYSVGGTAGATITFVDSLGVSHSVVNGIIVS